MRSMFASWLSTQFNPISPGFWLLVGVLLTLLLLSLQSIIPARWRRPIWFAHWLLVPYAGLLAGGLSPRLLGLGNIDWLASLGLGLGLIFGVVILLILVRAVVDLKPDFGMRLGSRQTSAADRPPWQIVTSTILWTGITQLHWAFLRGSIWEMLLTLPNPPQIPGYWAMWPAAGLILLEMFWAKPSFITLLIQLVTLLTTGILFFYTLNFWLCWILHCAIHFILVPRQELPLLPIRFGSSRPQPA